MKQFIQFATCIVLLLTALPSAADMFTSKNDAFTLDMPAGWTRQKNPASDAVLALQKGDARIEIKTTSCTTESCLDQFINRDLAEVKSKQMTVLKNTYTEEEIKRIEFSSGEPLYYISFYTPKNDFSAGYFLIDEKGYSILAKNITYAEADLIFSTITPHAQSTKEPIPTIQDEMGELDVAHAYDTQTVEEIEEVEIENLEQTPLTTPVVAPTSTTVALTKVNKPTLSTWKRIARKLQTHWRQFPVHTFVSPNMPPYIRELGHIYDAVIILICLFFTGWLTIGLIRVFIRPLRINMETNPNSLYPIKLERLYGTPSIIFRAKDNQGNILTALASRWDALLMFTGIIFMLVSLLTMAGASVSEQVHIGGISAFTYNTLYAVTSLVLPLGFLIFFCAIVWGQITMNEVILFDRKGQKAAMLVQKGYNVFKERYQLYFIHSKELMYAQRTRFSLRRKWILFSKEQVEFASIEERSAVRALLRMCCGHLWGLLRADYDIKGAMDSRGVLQNTHALFNKTVCNLDKPEAVNARDLLALSLLISIRDRDKWYPWFN